MQRPAHPTRQPSRFIDRRLSGVGVETELAVLPRGHSVVAMVAAVVAAIEWVGADPP